MAKDKEVSILPILGATAITRMMSKCKNDNVELEITIKITPKGSGVFKL